MSDEAKWYVVHTYSGYENKVASNLEKTVENHSLQNLIFEIRVPTEKVTEVAANGKTKEVERKIFPGYVIVKMILTDESWYAVRNIRGCTGFVGPSSKPIPLTDEEVERLGVETRNVEVSYNVGDSVQITDGPLRALSEQWKRLMWTRTTFASWFRCSDVKPRLTWNLTRQSRWNNTR